MEAEYHVSTTSQRDHKDDNVILVKGDDKEGANDEPYDAGNLSRWLCSPKECKFCRQQEDKHGRTKQIVSSMKTDNLENCLIRANNGSKFSSSWRMVHDQDGRTLLNMINKLKIIGYNVIFSVWDDANHSKMGKSWWKKQWCIKQ